MMPQHNNIFICSTKLLAKEMDTKIAMINCQSDHDFKTYIQS